MPEKVFRGRGQDIAIHRITVNSRVLAGSLEAFIMADKVMIAPVYCNE